MLGTNDAKPQLWAAPDGFPRASFVSALSDLAIEILRLPS